MALSARGVVRRRVGDEGIGSVEEEEEEGKEGSVEEQFIKGDERDICVDGDVGAGGVDDMTSLSRCLVLCLGC